MLPCAPDALVRQAKLDAVLTYHVLAGEVFSYQVNDDSTAATLNGALLEFQAVGGVLSINGATTKVINANLATSNGVVHVIDAVLLPPSMLLALA